jgi:nicotinate-nucleotide adenylyltransferase
VNIGIIGGTFDPIHNGHILIAREVKARLKLAEVIFVPAGQPWMKSEKPITPAVHRLEMVRMAIAPYPYFKVSTMEVDRVGPTYTIDTILGIRAKLNAEDEVYFILGWDSLVQFPRWRDAPRLIKMCRLTAVPRPGYTLPDLNSLEAKIPGLSGRVVLLDKPEIDISATDIRQRVAQGLSINHLVPRVVAIYIRKHRLYLTL